MDPSSADALAQAVISDPAMAEILTPMVLATLAGIALANVALVTGLKNALMALKQGGVKVLDSAWTKASMELIQPVLGGGMAVIPGILPFETAFNVVLGICAGFLSPFIYRQVLSKWFPNAVVSGDSDRREKHRDSSAEPSPDSGSGETGHSVGDAPTDDPTDPGQ